MQCEEEKEGLVEGMLDVSLRPAPSPVFSVLAGTSTEETDLLCMSRSY